MTEATSPGRPKRLLATLGILLKSLILLLALTGLLTLSLLVGGLIMFPSLLLNGINQLPPVASSVLGMPLDWQLSKLDLQQLVIDHFDAELADGTQIQLQQLTLDYDASGILQGQLKTIDAQSIAVTLGTTSDDLVEASAQQKQQAVALQLQQQWIELPQLQTLMALPVEQINIRQLNVSHPMIQTDVLVDMNSQRWRISGQIEPLFLSSGIIDANRSELWQLEFQLLANGQLLGQIQGHSDGNTENQQLLAHWFATLQQDDQSSRISARQVLVLPALYQQLSSRLDGLAAQTTDDSSLRLASQLLQQSQKLDTNISADLPNRFRWPQDVELSIDSVLTSVSTQPLTLDIPQQNDGQLQLNLQPLPASKNSGQAPANSNQLLTLALQHHASTDERQPWQLHLHANQMQAQGSQTSAESKFQWQGTIYPGRSTAQTTTATAQQAWFDATCTSDWSQCQISSPLTVEYNSHQAGQQINGKLTGQLSANLTSTGNTRFDLAVDNSTHAQLEDISIRAQLQSRLTGRIDPKMAMQLSIKDTSLTATSSAVGGWQPGELSLHQLAGLEQQWDLSGAEAILTDSSPLKMMIDPLTFKPDAELLRTEPAHRRSELKLGAATLDCQLSLSSPNCDARLRLRPSRWQQWPVPDVRLDISGQLDLATMDTRISGLIKAASGQLQAKFNASHNLEQQQGDAQFHIEAGKLAFASAGLGQLATLTGTNLLAGELGGQGWIEWDLPKDLFEPNMMLRLDGLSMVYDNRITLEDTSLLLAIRPQAGNYEVTGQLDADSFNSGVELSNSMARIAMTISHQFDWVTADIRELSTRLLGGQIYIPAVQYDSRNQTNSFGVRVDNLQLGQLAALEPSAEIDAEGSLDGSLPVILTANGPMIPKGTLYARSPGGVIRYDTATSASLASTDPSVALAMQLLENFQFNQLSSAIEYQPDGALNLGLKFEGHNPDFFNGQATHLNVNLDYNLLDLLASLRVADDLISELETRYSQ